MKTFRVEDTAGSTAVLHADLLSTANFPHIINIYKILIGRANIVHISSGEEYKCRFDFAKECTTNGIIGSKSLGSRVFGENTKTKDFVDAYKKLQKLNIEFYRSLCAELCHCIVSLEEDLFVDAYLHLYRSIEKIAVAFPLIYVSSIQDFKQSHKAMKEMFSGDKGELKFIEIFTKILSNRNPDLLDYDINFYTNYEEVIEFEKLVVQLRRAGIVTDDTELDADEGYFALNFVHVPTSIITVRNRLFHNDNSGIKNIDIDSIGGASELCRMMVCAGLHWLTIVFGEVIKERSLKI